MINIYPVGTVVYFMTTVGRREGYIKFVYKASNHSGPTYYDVVSFKDEEAYHGISELFIQPVRDI